MKNIAKRSVIWLLTLTICLTLTPLFSTTAVMAASIKDPVWPIDTAKSTSVYRKDWPTYSGTSTKHYGHDFTAPKGTPVYASADGTINAVSNTCTHNTAKTGKGAVSPASKLKENYGCSHYNTFGNYVRISHGNSIYTYYGHLGDIASGISNGNAIKAGDLIGYVGSTGASTGFHLHYEVRVGGTKQDDAVNPWDYLPGSPYKLTIYYDANGGQIESDKYKLSDNLIYVKDGDTKHSQVWNQDQPKPDGLFNATTFGLQRDGYRFVGWGTSSSGGTLFDQNDSTLKPRKINSNVTKQDCSTTLYAIWDKVVVEEPSPMPPAPNLDSASSWAKVGIQQGFERGFIPHDLQGSYKSVITRQEFCRMAVKWLECRTGKDIDTILAERGKSIDPNAFDDTSDPSILAAYALGITNGTKAPTAAAPGKFTPNGAFNREQAATMIRNTCNVVGMDTANPAASDFLDLYTAESWARDGINFVRANGIMQGDSTDPAKPTFNPKGQFTRETSILTFNNIK